MGRLNKLDALLEVDALRRERAAWRTIALAREQLSAASRAGAALSEEARKADESRIQKAYRAIDRAERVLAHRLGINPHTGKPWTPRQRAAYFGVRFARKAVP